MTVLDLIMKLSAYPEDLEVVWLDDPGHPVRQTGMVELPAAGRTRYAVGIK